VTKHAVTLKVTSGLHIECKFWLGDDGWNGSSEEPSVTVQAATFEQAKLDMESRFGAPSQITSARGNTGRGRAA